MAYREMGMWEILDVLRRVRRGETRSAIQRATGRSRPTVRRYVKVARKLGWEAAGGEPGEELAAAVGKRLRPTRDAADLGQAEALLAPRQDQLKKWLASSDFYEIILERHRRASTIVTSNRSIDEWIPLFDDPMLAQSAIDRFAHNSYQVTMEGDISETAAPRRESCRHALASTDERATKEAIEPATEERVTRNRGLGTPGSWL